MAWLNAYISFSWNKRFALLFIDNPVGTGFSYVENTEGYVSTEKQLGSSFTQHCSCTHSLVAYVESKRRRREMSRKGRGRFTKLMLITQKNWDWHFEANELFSLLKQFFAEHEARDVYIAGESYAGKNRLRLINCGLTNTHTHTHTHTHRERERTSLSLFFSPLFFLPLYLCSPLLSLSLFLFRTNICSLTHLYTCS